MSTETKTLSVRERQQKLTADMIPYLPANIDADRFQAFSLAVLRDPALAECSEKSKLLALVDCAKLGLYPDKNLGHVWLVPFNNNVGTYRDPKWEKQVTLIPGYQGYIELARRSGVVRSVHTDIVHEEDTFRVWTDDGGRHILHEPDPFALLGERGKPVGVYCIATMADGSRQIETMSYTAVLAIKARSKASKSGPWVTDEDMMARKTVVRRARKYWPQSPELAQFGAMDDKLDGVVDAASPPARNTVKPSVSVDDLMGATVTTEERPHQPKPKDKPAPDPKPKGKAAKSKPNASGNDIDAVVALVDAVEADDNMADQFEAETGDDAPSDADQEQARYEGARQALALASSVQAVDILVEAVAMNGDLTDTHLEAIAGLAEEKKAELAGKDGGP